MAVICEVLLCFCQDTSSFVDMEGSGVTCPRPDPSNVDDVGRCLTRTIVYPARKQYLSVFVCPASSSSHADDRSK
eukprot:2078843-Amphidinium_carterae.1